MKKRVKQAGVGEGSRNQEARKREKKKKGNVRVSKGLCRKREEGKIG